MRQNSNSFFSFRWLHRPTRHDVLRLHIHAASGQADLPESRGLHTGEVSAWEFHRASSFLLRALLSGAKKLYRCVSYQIYQNQFHNCTLNNRSKSIRTASIHLIFIYLSLYLFLDHRTKVRVDGGEGRMCDPSASVSDPICPPERQDSSASRTRHSIEAGTTGALPWEASCAQRWWPRNRFEVVMPLSCASTSTLAQWW